MRKHEKSAKIIPTVVEVKRDENKFDFEKLLTKEDRQEIEHEHRMVAFRLRNSIEELAKRSQEKSRYIGGSKTSMGFQHSSVYSNEGKYVNENPYGVVSPRMKAKRMLDEIRA